MPIDAPAGETPFGEWSSVKPHLFAPAQFALGVIDNGAVARDMHVGDFIAVKSEKVKDAPENDHCITP